MAGNFVGNVELENARIFSLNFSGREKVWNGKIINTEGTMNFCVSIPDDIAQDMIEDGWAVRLSAPRDENDEPSYFLPVEVKWRDRSRKLLPEKILPKIYMYSDGREVELDEDNIRILDGCDFETVDLVIHPRIWEDDNGERKIKAYLYDGRFVVRESRIARKYAHYSRENEAKID